MHFSSVINAISKIPWQKWPKASTTINVIPCEIKEINLEVSPQIFGSFSPNLTSFWKFAAFVLEKWAKKWMKLPKPSQKNTKLDTTWMKVPYSR